MREARRREGIAVEHKAERVELGVRGRDLGSTASRLRPCWAVVSASVMVPEPMGSWSADLWVA
ncbi:MAG TPA: hypothetical protein VMY41_05935 [Thermohalobaculum sp.]|nr:hypothetical protein [Thermohalobaculum sp.]